MSEPMLPTGRKPANPADNSIWLDLSLAAGDGTDAFADRLRTIGAARPGQLVVSADMPWSALEQYRRLAAVLYQAQANRGVKTAMVTSAYAAEGKSLTATNLALTLSESYHRRVLLIDADLRRPSLHDLFQIPNLAGVSDWLRGRQAERMPLVQITSHLTLLPGGRPDLDPMSVLASDRMKTVLTLAASRFDWVILDTPPVALLPDGHLLSLSVDTVVFVIAAGRVPAAVVKRAVNELGPERIIGVVLNRARVSNLSAYGERSYTQRYEQATRSPNSNPQSS